MTTAPPIKTGGDFGEEYERSRKLRAIYAKIAIRWIDWLLEGEGVDTTSTRGDVASGWDTVRGFLQYRVIKWN